MNILVHSWWFSAKRGSEFSVAYNFCVNMSRYHHLYFLVESNSYAWNDLSEMKDINIDNVDFITCPMTNRRLLALQRLFSKTPFGPWFSYYLFRAWEKGVYKFIKSSPLLDKIDLIHYACPVGYREPGYLWKLGKPYVWGSVCGMQLVSRHFIRAFTPKARFMYTLKNALNTLQFHFSRRIYKAFKTADVVVAAHTTVQRMLNKRLRTDRVKVFMENGIDPSKAEAVSEDFLREKYSAATPLRILFAGANNERKNPALLIDALEMCRGENVRAAFIGERMTALAEIGGGVQDMIKSGMVSLCDNIPREEFLKTYKDTDVLVITSAMEATTTALLEALENCVPCVTVDQCGMADVVKDGVTGRKFPVAPRDVMARSLAAIIKELCRDRSALLGYALNIKKSAYEFSYDARIRFFLDCYKEALAAHKEGVRD